MIYILFVLVIVWNIFLIFKVKNLYKETQENVELIEKLQVENKELFLNQKDFVKAFNELKSNLLKVINDRRKT